jgi:polyhydroxyalkanoate synthesis regulator phasin
MKEIKMDAKQIAKEMIAFHKAAFDNNFQAMTLLHEQTEKLINKFWEKSPLLPEESRQAISEWMRTYKKGREDFKKVADENFKKAENYFNEAK